MTLFLKSFITSSFHVAVPNPTPVCGPGCHTQNVLGQQQKAGLFIQVSDFFKNLFNASNWPARWHCGTWSDFHGWLYISSDLLIWASYFAIPFILIRILAKRSDILSGIVWLFVAFIILCGAMHLIDAIIFWWPAYRLSALIRFLTGIVSAVTVVALYRAMPWIISLRPYKELEKEIYERKAVEQQLKQSNELLSRSHQQLRTFTHVLSHNLRNHANNISLLTGLIDLSALDENNADMFNKIAIVSKGLNNTLDDLSEAIKIREGLIEKESNSFEETTAKVVQVLASEIEKNGASVEFNFETQNVLFPKLYLESILMNLISNAIKYRKEEEAPKIFLRTYNDKNGDTVLECSDNGLGIDLNLYGMKIFGLYETFHQNKQAHGVGLFLVKTQIESQGGNISVQSNPGIGTTFKITF